MDVLEQDERAAGMKRGGHDAGCGGERQGCRRYGAQRALFNALGLVFLAFPLCAGVPAGVRAAAHGPVILAFGDSLTSGFGLPERDGFPAQLQAKLRRQGIEARVENGGNSGDTTADGLARTDWELAQKPDLVILELGANDMLRGISPEIVRANLDKLVQKIKASGAKLLLAGMRSAPNWGKSYQREFDAIYPDLARRYQVPLYPFFLDDVAMQKDLTQADGLHPNERGVQVVVDRILPYVVRLLGDKEFGTGSAAAETIQLEDHGGTYTVPVRINGAIVLPFVVDSGASDVVIPADVFLTLTRTGTVGPADLIGTGDYALADGSVKPSQRFALREMEVGGYKLHDVVAIVVSVQGEPLLGQSFLSRLPSWEVDNQRHLLILNDDVSPPRQARNKPAPVPVEGNNLEVVRAFYSALAKSDGSAASALVVPEKRAVGPFSASQISKFYGTLREPLRLLAVRKYAEHSVFAEYTFVLPSGRRCDGRSVVYLSNRGPDTLIERIRALGGC
ncbi:MAG TPA: GDSL-type esterase/lipase family protein [Stellaceae bacterium]|nr:GDSL-type esterase/lipase family protein [Stellaceae bacterium]